MALADAPVADAQRVAAEELTWSKENPPQITENGDELTLWNFPVAKADLAPEHEEALRRFAGRGFVANSPQDPAMEFNVHGHASKTGDEKANRDFAEARAKNVEAVLRGLGFQKVSADSAGSSQPADEGPSGLALAHNRRVEVVRFTHNTYKVVDPEPPKPPPRVAKDPTRFRSPVDVKIKLLVRREQTERVMIAAWLIGNLRLIMRTGPDPVDAGVTNDRLELTEGFSQELARQIDSKLIVSEGADAGPPSIEVRIEAEEWFLFPKIYYQEGPYFIYFNFKPIDARLPTVEFGGTQVALEFSGNFRFEIGPSPSTIRTYTPSTTDPGPGVKQTVARYIPVDGGALLIAETITAAGKKATPLAQDEIKKVVLNLAIRDGAAARVAWIVLDDRAGYEAMRNEWAKRVGAAAGATDAGTTDAGTTDAGTATPGGAWVFGSDRVDDLLVSLHKAEKGADEARKNKWKAKYGGGQPKPDFDFVREAVFQDLKGYDDDQGDLPTLIDEL
jgi:outer membrane protein OmpA-like peptidoglycan-associated protein